MTRSFTTSFSVYAPHGWTRNLPKVNKVSGVKCDDPFEESSNSILPGYIVRPLEVEGAIGIEQLKKLPGFLEYGERMLDYSQSFSATNKRFRIQKR
jgi:CDP-6-deoxy-D-xylo-4-hexulose-3-dehydrase